MSSTSISCYQHYLITSATQYKHVNVGVQFWLCNPIVVGSFQATVRHQGMDPLVCIDPWQKEIRWGTFLLRIDSDSIYHARKKILMTVYDHGNRDCMNGSHYLRMLFQNGEAFLHKYKVKIRTRLAI